MNLFDFIILCFNAIKRLVIGVVSFVMQAFRLGLHYWWVVLVTMVVCFGCGVVLTRPQFKIYEGRVTIYVTDGMKDAAITGIRTFFQSGDTTRFAHYGISRDFVEAIRQLSFYDIIDSKCDSVPDFVDSSRRVSRKDSAQCVMTDRISMYVKTRGTDDFIPCMEGLNRYVSDLPWTHKADSMAKAQAQDKLDYLNAEVARLDSFITYDMFVKPEYYRTQGWGAQQIVAQREQKLHIAELRQLVSERDYVKLQIDRTPDVLNFESVFMVDSPVNMIYYKWSLVIGFCLGMIMALVVRERKEIFDYLKRRK